MAKDKNKGKHKGKVMSEELSNRKKLAKLIKKNPELPVVMIVSNESILESYGTTVQGIWCVEKTKAVYFNEIYIDDIDDFIDTYVNVSYEYGWTNKDEEKAAKAAQRLWNEQAREVIAIWTDSKSHLPAECVIEIK